MMDKIAVELDLDVADQIVAAWLKDNMQLIEDVYYGENKGGHENNDDYKALKQVLAYMTEPCDD